jgi:two-component system sensor histidine kinase KdpD
MSDLLVTDRSLPDLLQSTADTVRDVFGVVGVALLLPDDGHLTIVAAAGDAPSADDLRHLEPDSGVPVAVGPAEDGEGETLQAVVLSAAGRPVGILALRGPAVHGSDRTLLRTFVNHAALAIERAQLRDQALRSQLLEETDRMRRALLGAVSHDLRTPLATMKVAASSLIEADADLEPAERKELYGLIDGQADRLGRLVTGLLDMNRYQAGVLELRLGDCCVADLIDDAVGAMKASAGDRVFDTDIEDGLPPVRADRVLIGQVLVNLLDNADRHAPPGTPISLAARRAADKVLISVADQGPGVPEGERVAVFESFYGSDTGSRTGLGLWICRTFVEAHGEEIWVEGARFTFSLRAA